MDYVCHDKQKRPLDKEVKRCCESLMIFSSSFYHTFHAQLGSGLVRISVVARTT